MDNPTQSELSNPTSPPSTTPNLAQPLCKSKFNDKIHFEDSNLENGSLNNVYLIFLLICTPMVKDILKSYFLYYLKYNAIILNLV